jgi:RNA polymerase primary sigma factor
MAEAAEPAETGDAPLIDLNDADIKKLVARAKKRGYITVDQLNEMLPQDQMSSEQIEDVMSALNEMGVNVVENDEGGEDGEDQKDEDEDIDPVDSSEENAPALETKKKETIDRTDDPVRMYLREMGAVELLSREGEIAIAKRIEAGRDTMILGLCESPITFNAIIDWSTALNEGTMQLREILDLDAMLSKGPSAEQVASAEDDDSGEISEKTAGASFKEEEEPEEVQAADEDEDDMTERRAPRISDDEEEDNTLSLAQMEEQLKPLALERFANITSIYKKFSKMQGQRLDAMGAGGELSAAEERKYQKLREDLTAEVESVQFHQAKIEYLVDQLYSFNRRLTALGGQMLRLAERHKVARADFLNRYQGHELDDSWLATVGSLDKKWTAFAANEAGAVDRIRGEIRKSRSRPAWRFPSSAASSTWCRRASARRASRRRRWSRPIFAS